MTDHNRVTLLLFDSTSAVELGLTSCSNAKVFRALASKRDGLECFPWASW